MKTGNQESDHELQIDLCVKVLNLATTIQATSLICKVFQGNSSKRFEMEGRKFFKKEFKVIKPLASRKQSSEVYYYFSN